MSLAELNMQAIQEFPHSVDDFFGLFDELPKGQEVGCRNYQQREVLLQAGQFCVPQDISIEVGSNPIDPKITAKLTTESEDGIDERVIAVNFLELDMHNLLFVCRDSLPTEWKEIKIRNDVVTCLGVLGIYNAHKDW